MQHLRLKHPEIIFIVIGEGEEKDTLEYEIKARGLDQHVFLLGYVDNAAQYLRAFDCFLLSSLKEGLPYVLIEAGFAKLPTIATRVGGCPEIVGHMREGLLIDPAHPDAISDALELLLMDKNKQQQFGEALHHKVITHFGLAYMINQTLQLYDDTR